VVKQGNLAEVLRQSVLEKAFAGELVPHDPSDEPATILLESIAAEHDDATPAKPKYGTKRKPNA